MLQKMKLKDQQKKTVNRTQEELCKKGDLECLGQKSKKRMEESSDYIEDKSSEAVDQLD